MCPFNRLRLISFSFSLFKSYMQSESGDTNAAHFIKAEKQKLNI